MRRFSPIGWLLIGVTVVIAVELIVVSITGATGEPWASNWWGAAFVILIVVAAVLAIATFGAALVAHRAPEISIKANPLAQFLFQDTNSAVLWMIIRIYVGLQWFEAGFEKVRSPAWTGAAAGTALKGFVLGAIGKGQGEHALVQGWYVNFLNAFIVPNVHWFSYLVAYGELVVGIALIVGAFTGVAAFFGAFMNMNYMLAGTTSTNPILAFLELFLILAWRVAGYYGLDNWLLPALGTPWEPGTAFRGQQRQRPAAPPEVQG